LTPLDAGLAPTTDLGKGWLFAGLTPGDIPARAAEIGAAYQRHGVVVFPGLLAGNPALDGFLAALRYLFGRILARYSEGVGENEDIGDILVRLKAIAPLDGKIVADMGTQHNKLIEANRLKHADFVMALLRLAFGPDAVLATPQAGDTLHLFMPGEEFHLQPADPPGLSLPDAVAAAGDALSRPLQALSGRRRLEFWPGSQRLGVLPCGLNAHGAFEVKDAAQTLAGFPASSISGRSAMSACSTA
jgi:hypothetical protein